MIIVRPIDRKDQKAFEEFAYTTHVGVTSLPNNKEALQKKITTSLASFDSQINVPGKELYIFILEDNNRGKQGGTCAIWAKTGVSEPLYFYRIETLYHDHYRLPLPIETRVLHSVTRTEGPSEICGLYLLPEFRHSGLGRLLSLSRFLFIASFPQRFNQSIISNMRGIIDENDRCPFWDGLGKCFLDMEFADVMHEIAITRDFIPHILPKYPIYVSLLPKKAQEAIGETHPHTTPALSMLSQEGFRFTHEIDIFDGGPMIAAPKIEIQSISNSQTGKVSKIYSEVHTSTEYLISNNRLDFRACFGKITIENDETVGLYSDVAQALEIKEGDTIRYVTSGHL
jgi:arginine N-succinyltransferase